jgi:hypothetical protein
VPNFLDMQNRIDDELDRGGAIFPQIKKAIVTAVRFYERKRFYFAEDSFTFATVVGQEYYTTADAAAIATSPNIERLNGSFYGTRIPLTKRSFEYIDDISTLPVSMSMPEDWAYRELSIRLYPIPDQVYTITAYNVPRLTELSADTDSNAWTNDAEALIRARAKWDLVKNVIRGPEMAEEAAGLKIEEEQEFTALIKETASREALGHSVPTQF